MHVPESFFNKVAGLKGLHKAFQGITKNCEKN